MSNHAFSYDTWFSDKLAPDGDIEDGCHPGEAKAMKDYLRQKTTAHEAARAITNPISTAESPKEDLHRLWGFLANSLIELPLEHVESLIVLLQAIENLPEPHFASTQTLWRGLGNFGHMWSDGYMNGGWKTEAQNAEPLQRDLLRQTHVRKAEAEARLAAAGVGGIPIDWGYEVVADALESSNALLDFEVPAAAQWLVICGRQFHQGAVSNQESWGLKQYLTQDPGLPSRDLWKVPQDEVMTLERWSLWEQRLDVLRAESGAVGEAARVALQSFRNYR